MSRNSLIGLFVAIMSWFVFANAGSSEAEIPGKQVVSSDYQEIDEGEDRIRTLTLEEAQTYMLSLLNKDRATFGLASLSLDQKANEAAQFHAVDTAKRAYNHHYSPEGTNPVWRYNLLGGTQEVSENQIGAYFNSKYKYRLARRQRFAKQELESLETAFFDEKPPNDGHRKSILNARHNKVGIGLCSFVCDKPNGEQDLHVTCCQEFINSYGSFLSLPFEGKVGDSLSLVGRLDSGLTLVAIDIRRDDLPKALAMDSVRINAYHDYSLAKQVISSIKAAEIGAKADGSYSYKFNIPETWQSGLYYFVVWASDGKSTPFVVSRQIVALGSPQPIKPLDVPTVK